jgi:hypothetical protein
MTPGIPLGRPCPQYVTPMAIINQMTDARIKLDWKVPTKESTYSFCKPRVNKLYRVYLECLDKHEEWVPHTKTSEKISYQYMPAYKFRGRAKHHVHLILVLFLSVGTLKTRDVLSSNWKWSDTSPTHFDTCPTSHNRPGRLVWCDGSWSDVSLRALIQVGRILSICCELRLHEQ